MVFCPCKQKSWVKPRVLRVKLDTSQQATTLVGTARGDSVYGELNSQHTISLSLECGQGCRLPLAVDHLLSFAFKYYTAKEVEVDCNCIIAVNVDT